MLCKDRGNASVAREQRKLAAIVAADVVGYLASERSNLSCW